MPINSRPSLTTAHSTAHTRAASTLVLALSLLLASCANADAGPASDPAVTAGYAEAGDVEPTLESEPELESRLDVDSDPDSEAEADAWILPDLERVCDGGSELHLVGE